jgi:two-component system nitrogen regulation sensor histidine kinase GlnL
MGGSHDKFMKRSKDSKLIPEAVLDVLTTAVLVVEDEALTIGYMNSAAEALFGTSKHRSIGTSALDLLHDSPGSEGVEAFNRFADIFTSEQSFTRRATEFRTRSGEEVTADLTVSLDAVSRCLIIELQPINRLVRINRDDQALASAETTRRLVRGLAHEIKNPLGGLRGAAQLLERELENRAHTEYTGIIIQEADRLSELVDRLLGPSREPRIEPSNIHELLEHVVRLVDAEMPGQARFVRDYDPSLPEIQSDESQIIRALLNVVRNAWQILDEQPPANGEAVITLRTRVVRTFTLRSVLHRMVARIDIIDNGPGVAEDLVGQIFVPMISGRPQGTGLGLAIAQSIISQHGGVIECASRPGKTCFSVFLPLEEPVNDG